MKKIYQVTLQSNLMPGENPEEAFNRVCDNLDIKSLDMDYFKVEEVISAENTAKLYNTARMLYAAEKYEYKETEAMVHALATSMGYTLTAEEVASAILVWVERLEDTDDDEFFEWLNS